MAKKVQKVKMYLPYVKASISLVKGNPHSSTDRFIQVITAERVMGHPVVENIDE